MTPGEAAKFLRVDPKTLTRWARKGLIKFATTAGGHRRYPLSEVLRISGRQIPPEDKGLSVSRTDLDR
jgi:excisionase family DNA binding protein